MVKVAVVGAGIMGVSTAYRLLLQQPDYNVTILAKAFSPNTTSDGAAGFWEPYFPGDTAVGIIRRQSKETYDYVMDLLKTNPNSSSMGLSTVHGFKISKNENTQIPFWADIPNDSNVLNKSEIARRFPDVIKSGISFTTVFVEGSKLIPYYLSRIKELGGKIIQWELKSLNEIGMDYDVIVNCTGLGSRELVNDQKMFPIRGQIVLVHAPWVKEFIMWQEDDKQTYVLPNQDYVVLGGTAHRIDNKDALLQHKQHILESTKSILPSLEKAKVIRDWVGFRPAREGGARSEIEDYRLQNKRTVKVVHNYGHGGSGMTLFWGCAKDTVHLILQAAQESKLQSKL